MAVHHLGPQLGQAGGWRRGSVPAHVSQRLSSAQQVVLQPAEDVALEERNNGVQKVVFSGKRRKVFQCEVFHFAVGLRDKGLRDKA